MTALEKLTLLRLEERVAQLEAALEECIGRLEKFESVTYAACDACAALLIRLDDLEQRGTHA